MAIIKRNMRHRQSEAKKEVEANGIKQVLVDQSLEKYAERATIVYGTEVLEDRAVPDFRDGLKPVQRAILWSMYGLNLHHNGPYKKAARVVGEVIGSYHPHGDGSTYQAMVNMVNAPTQLVDGYGNWGSHVEDAAAYRYSMRGDTKISTEYGLVEIEKLPEFLGVAVNSDIIDINVKVPSLNGKTSTASKWMYNGKRKCFNVTTRGGTVISSTKDHKFYVYDSSTLKHKFVRLEDLRVGDYLCLNRENAIQGSFQKFQIKYPRGNYKQNHLIKEKSSLPLARFLGHMVAEGYVNFDTGLIQFATTSKSSMADFEGAFIKAFPNFPYTIKIEKPRGYGKKNVARFKCIAPKILDFLKCIGFKSINSYTQRVPTYLFTSSQEEVSNFLQAYYEGDGTANFGQKAVNVVSVSHKLLTDIQILLSTFYGIVSRLHLRKSLNTLFISNLNNIELFESSIGFISKRKQSSLKRILNDLKASSTNSSTSKFDCVFGFKSYIKDFVDSRRVTLRSIRSDSGKILTTESMKTFFTGRSVHEDRRRFQEDYDTIKGDFWINEFKTLKDKLDEIYSSNYFYDPIVSIEYDGIHKVYDLSVEGTNAFVANGLMVHNCFVAGTKVMTSYGLVNIEHIPQLFGFYDKPNTIPTLDIDLEVASSGVVSKAIKWLYSGKHKTYKVTTRLGYSVQCTINEPFLQINKDLDYVWVPLQDLKVGDHVCLTGMVDLIVHDTGFDKQHAYMIALLSKAKIEGSNQIFYGDYISGRFYSLKNMVSRFADCHDIVYDYREEVEDKKLYFTLNSDESLFDKFGIYDWNEYTSYVPSLIFKASAETVASYLFGIFTMYTKIIGTEFNLSARSRSLLNDVKQLLLNYFGIVTGPIVEADNGFLLISVYDIQGCINNNLIHPSTINHYKQVLNDERTDLNKTRDYDIIPFAEAYINDGFISLLTDSDLPENEVQKIRVLSSHATVLERQLDFKSLPDTNVINKLCKVLDNNYTYDIIESIQECSEQDVFDLTVEGTHAFVANGFVVHNTEARLSKYSDLYLLDPEYLAVTDMRPNYSEDRMMPTVLPSKVPNMLLVGNSSIAVGISASSPPFEMKGVLALTEMCLNKVKLTEALCIKHLRYNYRYGGKCLSAKQDLTAFYSSGKGTLEFEPSYTLTKKELIITSTCPGLNSQNSIQKLLDNLSAVPGVKLVYDNEDKGGIQYVVQFGKISEDKKALAIEACLKLIRRKERYDMGAVERLPSNTQFMRLSPMQLIEKWCEWRIDIEKKVISNRILKCEKQLKHLALMILAVDNLKIIIESLSKTDSESYLMQKLKIAKEDADVIMDMRVRQLKKLEKKSLVERIKTEQTALKAHSVMLKKPHESIIDTLKKLI